VVQKALLTQHFKLGHLLFRISYCLFKFFLKLINKNIIYGKLWYIVSVLYYSTVPVKYKYSCMIYIYRAILAVILTGIDYPLLKASVTKGSKCPFYIDQAHKILQK